MHVSILHVTTTPGQSPGQALLQLFKPGGGEFLEAALSRGYRADGKLIIIIINCRKVHHSSDDMMALDRME